MIITLPRKALLEVSKTVFFPDFLRNLIQYEVQLTSIIIIKQDTE